MERINTLNEAEEIIKKGYPHLYLVSFSAGDRPGSTIIATKERMPLYKIYFMLNEVNQKILTIVITNVVELTDHVEILGRPVNRRNDVTDDGLINSLTLAYAGDVKRIQEILEKHGVKTTPKVSTELWESYSFAMVAGWMALPEDDEKVFELLKPHLLNFGYDVG